ncbi:hypothetical protein ROZALSC1DRAFT_29626 [Rozella allomycis CSF55]|uniref:Uncharacterized protein n=1 Tax=Rozella allomycis (strain CSF55) TaxID=988480 RepID=A0A4P9YGR1_ROZAC|nr:hypothetical protein ROZALSC1DRAFT_29626 [Rozella allomycis CSF55]
MMREVNGYEKNSVTTLWHLRAAILTDFHWFVHLKEKNSVPTLWHLIAAILTDDQTLIGNVT